ncbi:ABC transporter C family member 7-like [Solanum stenotomum]|uniref:ABC transporter C family member 7-like n=1 Tax=Solanum stenotomum TaxID=172797 RepID=UPI0020D07E56|nr:ABC transporter C family member 7-like [Solanum stenotomum]
MFKKCLIQLLHEKPVVYATHQLEFLDSSDLILVLQKCHLADIVKQDLRLLDAPVAEDGENLSVDQRQIVCLGCCYRKGEYWYLMKLLLPWIQRQTMSFRKL